MPRFQWRHFQYRRIDGTTSLDDREDAIVDFNRPESEVFIFLLSIRAAGRGLNLQTADTVVVYDPDPNPKNEVRKTRTERVFTRGICYECMSVVLVESYCQPVL